MTQYNGNYTDENGRPVEGASVFVYTAEGELATITDTNDNPINQPITTDHDGNFSYRAPDGYYQHQVWVGKRRVLIENEVILGPSYAQTAADSALAAQAFTNYRATRADGVADFVPGEFFSSAETGELRLYERIVGAPYYEDQGDAAAPVSKQTFIDKTADIYTPDQALFPFSFAFGDGLRNLVDDPGLPNVGGNNHAFGLGALLSLTGETSNANPNAGYGNCAFGPNVMRDADNAYDNTGMGYETLRKLTEGYNNAAYGPKALYECTSGYRNVAIGTTSFFSGTTLFENVAIGVDAAFNATTCFGNVVAGYQAGYRLTTGSHNVGIGWKSLSGIAGGAFTGARAVGVGYRALGSATSASDTNAVGANALVSCTTGSGNNAFGSSALSNIINANGNSGFGDGALQSYTGSLASAFGGQALVALTTGQNAAAFGYEAGRDATTANHLTAFGYRALYRVQDGSGNVGMGRLAGGTLTNGGSNVFIGDVADALAGATGFAVAIGAAAAAGSEGIAIGAGASAAAETGATNADKTAQFALGSAAHPVAVRGDGTLFPAAGAAAGFAEILLNGTPRRIELFAPA